MKIELLSPAGNFESLISAVNAGADAVYLGAKSFSARASAANFTDEEILEGVKFAHLRSVKVYVTVNILLSDQEFKDAIELVEFLYRAGVDGIIVQDPALGLYIKGKFKNLEVHASTQMTINNYYGGKFLKNLNFDRLVLARETSLNEIKKIKELSIDIEHFIHGALCVSYSGQCLMSSMIGGRSGNRGDCAQACRKPYEILNQNKRRISQKGYFISPMDLQSFTNLDTLIKSGVNSLKIEGRMKNSRYTYQIVKSYRKALDKKLDEGEINKSKEIFNREWTKGIPFGAFGSDFVSIDRPDNRGIEIGKIIKKVKDGYIIDFYNNVNKGDSCEFIGDKKFTLTMFDNFKRGQNFFKTKRNIEIGEVIRRLTNIKLNESLDEEIKKSYKKIPISFNIELRENKNPIIKVETEEKEILYQGYKIIESAKKSPISRENVEESFSKLNNTGFRLSSINIKMDNNIFIPISYLNELRREALKKFEDLFTNREIDIKTYELEFKNRKKDNKKLILELKSTKDFEKINFENIDYIYLDLKFIDKKEIFKFKNKIFIVLPTILDSKQLENAKEKIEKLDIAGIVISNLSQIEIFKNYKGKKHGDIGLNVFNSYTGEFLLNNLNSITLSPEMNYEQIKNLKVKGNLESIVYGFIPAMTMEHCPNSIIKKCKDSKECQSCSYSGLHYLRDTKDVDFPFERSNKKTIIYNSYPIFYSNERLTEFVPYRRIIRSFEDYDTINKITYAFKTNNFNGLTEELKDKFINVTKGHYNRGVI